MITKNAYKTPENDLTINFEALCQEFDGQSFYGLEYILEDLFQNSTIRSAGNSRVAIDKVGLYN